MKDGRDVVSGVEETRKAIKLGGNLEVRDI
jgi:hypothetical protein